MLELTLSVLDQSSISAGGDGVQANAETLHCDGLGFHRYWLAEFYGTPALAGSSPEILISRVASLTEHMRIGAGGAMVNHYAAMKVAENFRLLEALFPVRVDLGLARAPGGDRWFDRDYSTMFNICWNYWTNPMIGRGRAGPKSGCWEHRHTRRDMRRHWARPIHMRISSINRAARR